jgi:protein DGCR14
MFPPDADVSPYHPPMVTRPTKAGDPKSIKHNSTRLPQDEHSASSSRGLSAPPSPTRSRIDAAISGAPYHPRSPTANNFSLVPNLPSPTASELGPAAVKQLMTWGTITGTPRIISTEDPALVAPTTPFHLPAPSSRERISHRLSNNASKSLRARAGLLGLATPGSSRPLGTPGGTRKGNMAPPSWTPRRAEAVGNLTPAARQLLNRSTMGSAAARKLEMQSSAANKEKDLNRVRWTPSPSPVPRRG